MTLSCSCEEFTEKSCCANFFKLKNKIMLGEYHVSRGHVMRELPVYYCPNTRSGSSRAMIKHEVIDDV